MMKHINWMVGVIGLSLSVTVNATVLEFNITHRGPVYDGKSFGSGGQYERIDGVARIAVDPHARAVKDVVDIGLVPTNEKGLVEFSTQVTILRPQRPTRATSTLLYEVVNRGSTIIFPMLNRDSVDAVDFDLSRPGDGFLMEQGYTLAWSGWQAGLGANQLSLQLPVIPEITGASREEIVFDNTEHSSRLKLTYPASSLDTSQATLSVRDKALSARRTLGRDAFRYISDTEIEIQRPKDADAGAIYEFIYTARAPMPTGLGFVATAEVVSFLRGSGGDKALELVGPIKNAVAIGVSQSGRYLRDFLYQGFNANDEGGKVFDGMIIHVAGAMRSYTNARFAQPARFSRQHESHDYPGDQFPFAYSMTTDPVTGQRDSIQAKCEQSGTCPLIMHTDTSAEFWQNRASLVSTGFAGEALPVPENVRLYFFPGAPHYNLWARPVEHPKQCALPRNPLTVALPLRALLTRMVDWTAEGVPPPASAFPAGSHELVPASEVTFPKIPGISYNYAYNGLNHLDHTALPPKHGSRYAVLMPQVDRNGNSKGGIRIPYLAVPTATYWGWNPRSEGYGSGELCYTHGSMVKLPAKPIDGDDRQAISELYSDKVDYLAKLHTVSLELVRMGFLLSADVETVLDSAPEIE